MKTTEEILDEIERVAESTTPGMWEFCSSKDLRRGSVFVEGMFLICEYEPDDLFDHRKVDNFKFIAHCNPQTVLRLVRALRLALKPLNLTGDEKRELISQVLNGTDAKGGEDEG